MNYLKIEHEDVCNGTGLRVVLWLSGCSHHCYNCQNPQTWNPDSGISFDESAKEEIFNELSKDYISGLTLTGGDPLHENNLDEVLKLVQEIRISFPEKSIWLYTGYTLQLNSDSIPTDDFWNEPDEEYSYFITTYNESILNKFKRKQILSLCNVVVDGEYIDEQKDLTLKFRGSKNQRVINVPESLKQRKVVLYCE